MSQSVGSSIGGLLNGGGIRYLQPPPTNLGAVGALGAVGVVSAAALIVDVIGRLGGYDFRDNLINQIPPPRGGFRENQAPPPFTGGQSLGVTYLVTTKRTDTETGGISYDTQPVPGPIYGAEKRNFDSSFDLLGISHGNNQFFIFYFVPKSSSRFIFEITQVVRQDGQADTGGNPPPTSPPTIEPTGYTGPQEIGGPESLRGASDRRSPAPPPAGFAPPPAGFAPPPAALGFGTGTGVAGLAPPPAAFSPSPQITPTPTGDRKVGAPVPPPVTSPPPTTTPPPPVPDRDDDRAPVPPPTTPPPPPPATIPPELKNRIDNIDQNIAQIGSISAIIAAQTTPEAQRLNSKNGACDALNSDPCTQKLTNSIKNPLDAKLDAAQVARDANAATQTGLLGSIISSLGTIGQSLATVGKFAGSLYNNQFVQSSINYLTFATTIHNAALLTRDIGETLGGVIDNGLSLAGRQFQDSEGNSVPFSELVGNNAKALIIRVIGAERYADLTLKWQKASVVLNSAANIINTTQSMLDPLSTAIEYGMENVSKIGNGLRDDGVVGEFAYGNMDETITARKRNRFEVITDNLEGAENVVSNLSNVTSSAVSVKEDFRQLKEDKQTFQNSVIEASNVRQEERNDIIAAQPIFNDLSLVPAPNEDEPETPQ